MDVSKAGNCTPGGRPAEDRGRPGKAVDAERQCPSARYKISRAVCNERQRRGYFECPDCKWSEINRERASLNEQNDKIRQRYGFL